MNQPLALRNESLSEPASVFPYHLRPNHDDPGNFYEDLNEFTQLVILKGLTEFLGDIRSFRQSEFFLSDSLQQSHEENLADLLIIGTLWNEYNCRFAKISGVDFLVFRNLIRIRNHSKRTKSQIDIWRGKLGQKWLLAQAGHQAEANCKNVSLLIRWLEATGDFHGEANRMAAWTNYFIQLPDDDFKAFFGRIVQFASWFKAESRKQLGQYTYGVEAFLSSHEERYSGREDYFFTGRSEVEYHLNMVGAAIMNRNLKPAFDKTDRKILMLPSCMIKNPDCKASDHGTFSVCRHCTSGCTVSELSEKIGKTGVDTIIVQHSSDFSNTLKKWANQNHTGLIGTACALNLLEGGFEMKKNRIPSQCIFLENSCCRKHWGLNAVTSNIDLKQLEQIIRS